MIAPLPGVKSTKPGSSQAPIPGISVDVVDDTGENPAGPEGGLLVIRQPWPAMLRGIWKDPERFKDTYRSRVPNTHFAGDGARRDADGDTWPRGHVDAVMTVPGHRPATAEIE